MLEEEEASFDDVDLNEAIEDKTPTVGSKKNLLWWRVNYKLFSHWCRAQGLLAVIFFRVGYDRCFR